MKTMFKILLVATISTFLSATEAEKLPESFTRCELKNADKCWPQAIENAVMQMSKPIKSIGLPSLDPLEIPSLKIGAGKGPVQVDQNFHDLKFYGLQKLKVNTLKLDTANKNLETTLIFPEIKLMATYEIDGQVLILPIKGKGPSTIILSNVEIRVAVKTEVFKKKGEDHLKFSEMVLKMSPEKVSFNFENLFNGDKALGDNMNKLLNDNQKEVFQDVKSGYEQAIGQIILSLLNKVFSRVPMTEVFLNY